MFKPHVVTKRPYDIFELDVHRARLASIRKMMYLAVIRDPRDLVSSIHSSVPNQWFQGTDYTFLPAGRIRSLCRPGVAAVFSEIARQTVGLHRMHVLRYEDILADPEAVRRMLHFSTGFRFERPFSEFHITPVPDELGIQLNGLRPPERQERPRWTTSARLDRVARQIMLHPELEALARQWGYPAFDEVCARHGLQVPDPEVPRGTIVAFHTDDEVYRAEAERFTHRLDTLGLNYDITVLPSKADWVANCAIKASFLCNVRKRLRGPLLYLDVDAYVHADPWAYVSQFEGDLAAFVGNDGELFSGTILLRDTVKCQSALKEWALQQKQQPKEWDQRVLRRLVEKNEAQVAEPSFSFQRLPTTLCFIFDRKYPHVCGRILIEHLQASRETKFKHKYDNLARRRKRIAELWG